LWGGMAEACGGQEMKALESLSGLLYLRDMASKAHTFGGQHVVPGEKGWTVLRAGASRVTSNHSTQEAAILAATRIAKNQKTELYIHGRDGRIREKTSYGRDPHPPKG
jgi:Uncharacterized protein conserved in bacteria (DUF2188)